MSAVLRVRTYLLLPSIATPHVVFGSIKIIDTVFGASAKRAHQCLDLTNVLLLAPVRVLAMESNVLPHPVLVTQLPPRLRPPRLPPRPRPRPRSPVIMGVVPVEATDPGTATTPSDLHPTPPTVKGEDPAKAKALFKSEVTAVFSSTRHVDCTPQPVLWVLGKVRKVYLKKSSFRSRGGGGGGGMGRAPG